MELKITGHNTERFKDNLDKVLSVATLVCLGGYVPTEMDIKTPETRGLWYYKDSDRRYNLVPTANDYWANIREEGEKFIVLEFNFRYDRENRKHLSLSNLLLVFFPDFVELK
jgi:hypothetical protein